MKKKKKNTHKIFCKWFLAIRRIKRGCLRARSQRGASNILQYSLWKRLRKSTIMECLKLGVAPRFQAFESPPSSVFRCCLPAWHLARRVFLRCPSSTRTTPRTRRSCASGTTTTWRRSRRCSWRPTRSASSRTCPASTRRTRGRTRRPSRSTWCRSPGPCRWRRRIPAAAWAPAACAFGVVGALRSLDIGLWSRCRSLTSSIKHEMQAYSV